MKAAKVLAVPLIASLFTSCLTPAYRDQEFFFEDRTTTERFSGDDPYPDLEESRSKEWTSQPPLGKR